MFNHKPFVFGEIRFIVREFEEIRSESDLNQFIDTLQRLDQFRDAKIESAIDLCHKLDEKLSPCLDSFNNLMQEVLGLEEEHSSLRIDVLKSKSEQRTQEMMALIEASKERISQIDEQFEEEENKLKLFYKDLETKLKISPN